MPRNLFRSVILVALLVPVVNAATPVETQKARHEHYEKLGKAFKAVRDQTSSDAPDFAVLQQNAEIVNEASVNQQQWFPKGTGPEAGKTRALPEIWSKPADFEAAQKMFSDRAPKLLAAAKARDVDAAKAAFKDLGGACKNCHDGFRAPEH
jgi:cytochrome c556